MKFEKIVLELKKYETLDIIAASPENPTKPSQEVTTKYDPFEADKW